MHGWGAAMPSSSRLKSCWLADMCTSTRSAAAHQPGTSHVNETLLAARHVQSPLIHTPHPPSNAPPHLLA